MFLRLLSKICDFSKRKSRFFYRSLSLLGKKVRIGSSSNISPTARIEPWTGSIDIGEYALIDHGAIIRAHEGSIFIDDFVTLGPYSIIYGGGIVKVGKATRIGPHVCIVAGNHSFADKECSIYLQAVTTKGVEIGDDVWIGSGAIILDGVKIGRGAVIAAGAVVNTDVSDFTVVAGIPARPVKRRGDV